MVAGADPHFTHLCERGALGRGVGCCGEGDTLAVGGGAGVRVSPAGRLYGLLPAEPVRSRCYALSRAVFSRPVLSVGYWESVFIAVGVIAV